MFVLIHSNLTCRNCFQHLVTRLPNNNKVPYIPFLSFFFSFLSFSLYVLSCFPCYVPLLQNEHLTAQTSSWKNEIVYYFEARCRNWSTCISRIKLYICLPFLPGKKSIFSFNREKVTPPASFFSICIHYFLQTQGVLLPH